MTAMLEQGQGTTTTSGLARVHKWLLVVIPTLAAFGPVLMLVRPIYAFRVAAVLLALVTAIAVVRGHRRRQEALGRAVAITAAVWLISGAITVGWVSDRHAAFSDLLSIGCGLVVVVSAMQLAPARQVFSWLAAGWVVAFAVAGLIAMWEIISHHHLSNYVLTPYLKAGLDVPFVASTFANPNLFALFMAMGLPILLYLVHTSTDQRARVGFVALTLWLLVLLVYTGSRLGLVASVVTVVVWFFCTPRAWRSPSALVVVGGLVAVVAFSVVAPFGVTGVASDAPPPKLSNTTMDEILGKTTAGAPNSGSVRVDMIKRGADMLVDSKGLGVGPGNFAAWIDEHGERYPLAGVRSPHNAAVELGAQYGAIALLATVVLFFLALRTALRTSPGTRLRLWSRERPLTVLVLSTAVGFPFYAMCNSVFWPPPTTWVALAVFLTAAAAAPSQSAD